MSGKDLRLPQRAALLALMGMGREVANPELEQLTGLTLTGKERIRLNDDGLVVSRKVGRAFVHELTDKGWRWCADELGAACPARAGSGGGALYAVLAGLGRFLQRSDLQLADVFGPTAATDLAATGPAASEDLAVRIRAGYWSLARRPGEWVSLTALRPLLGAGVPRGEVDAELIQMSRARQVNLVPQSNQKVLTAADRDAAILVGDQDNHLISIEEEP